jgi:hypothetical protein
MVTPPVRIGVWAVPAACNVCQYACVEQHLRSSIFDCPAKSSGLKASSAGSLGIPAGIFVRATSVLGVTTAHDMAVFRVLRDLCECYLLALNKGFGFGFCLIPNHYLPYRLNVFVVIDIILHLDHEIPTPQTNRHDTHPPDRDPAHASRYSKWRSSPSPSPL